MNPVSSSPAYSRKGKTFVLPLPMPFTVNILLVAVNNIGTLWSVRYHCDRYTKFFFNIKVYVTIIIYINFNTVWLF